MVWDGGWIVIADEFVYPAQLWLRLFLVRLCLQTVRGASLAPRTVASPPAGDPGSVYSQCPEKATALPSTLTGGI